MALNTPTALANSNQRDLSNILKKTGMSDSESKKPGSPSGKASEGIQQVLDAEASLKRAAAGGARAGLPPTLGARTSAFTQRDQMLAAVPPGLRPSQSLDLTTPGLRPSQSLGGAGIAGLPSSSSLDLAAAVPPSLRPSQSLDFGPPGLARGTSLELAAARRAAGLGGYPGAYPGAYPGGYPGAYPGAAAAAMMYDPRRRLLLAQQAAAAMPSAAFSGGFGPASMMMGPWGRNLPTDAASSQGLDLLRAASLQLPNRMGAMPGVAAAAAGMGGPMPGVMGMPQQQTMPGFSPDRKPTATSNDNPGKKRKSKDGDSSDEEESSDKVFIPEIRDLDILCGRGGKSNHHFGNKRYRQVVSEMKNMYRSTEAKTVKTDLSRAIVDHVCSYGGRFVKRDEATGKYYLLTKAEARKKTSQALRETKALKWTM